MVAVGKGYAAIKMIAAIKVVAVGKEVAVMELVPVGNGDAVINVATGN